MHEFQRGGCMSRCRCGATFSNPIHGDQPDTLKRLREVVLLEISVVDIDAPPGEMDRYGAWAFEKKGSHDGQG